MSNQERRLMRRMSGGVVGGGHYPTQPPWTWTPQDEQDGKRDRLAERLLEIALEQFYPSQFIDTKDGPEDSPTQTVRDWFTRVAEASISAAEVIYPEIPTQSGANAPMTAVEWAERNAAESAVLAAAVQEGAQSVGGFPVLEPRPTIAELEARLNRGEQVDIAPDGTIRGEG